ncbi:Uncharacterized protein Rs2_14671 [Raphanus sativus]|nr:Uncharacterized protein Rs2_14671 [Raphanus sativus]
MRTLESDKIWIEYTPSVDVCCNASRTASVSAIKAEPTWLRDAAPLVSTPVFLSCKHQPKPAHLYSAFQAPSTEQVGISVLIELKKLLVSSCAVSGFFFAVSHSLASRIALVRVSSVE